MEMDLYKGKIVSVCESLLCKFRSTLHLISKRSILSPFQLLDDYIRGKGHARKDSNVSSAGSSVIMSPDYIDPNISSSSSVAFHEYPSTLEPVARYVCFLLLCLVSYSMVMLLSHIEIVYIFLFSLFFSPFPASNRLT